MDRTVLEDEFKSYNERKHELDLCPFCGSELLLTGFNYIRCQGCGVVCSVPRAMSRQELVSSWNRRVGWFSMDSAPKDKLILCVVDDAVRIVAYGKTSHVPLYGFCLADQGPEDFELCEPKCWRPLPTLPGHRIQ